MSSWQLNTAVAAVAGSDHESHGVQGDAIHTYDLLSFLAEGPFEDLAQDLLVEDYYCSAKLSAGPSRPEALVLTAAFDPALPGTEASPASTLSSQGALH